MRGAKGGGLSCSDPLRVVLKRDERVGGFRVRAGRKRKKRGRPIPVGLAGDKRKKGESGVRKGLSAFFLGRGGGEGGKEGGLGSWCSSSVAIGRGA